MIAIVSEDYLIGEFKHKSVAKLKAKTFVNKTRRKFYVVQVLDEISPEVAKKAMQEFYRITGLDKETVLDVRSNHSESKLIRAWLTFLMVVVQGETKQAVTRMLRIHPSTIDNYLRLIPRYAKYSEWVNAKWQPLISLLLSYNPNIFENE